MRQNHKIAFSEKYQGTGEFTLVSTLRGTKNFHDGQWQGWLGEDMEAIIDLEKEISISQVTIGSMENQGSGIYYPIKIDVFVSDDGENYRMAGSIDSPYKKNAGSALKDFKVNFTAQKRRYVKVIATNLKRTPTGTDVWLFIDEVLIK